MKRYHKTEFHAHDNSCGQQCQHLRQNPYYNHDDKTTRFYICKLFTEWQEEPSFSSLIGGIGLKIKYRKAQRCAECLKCEVK